MSAFTVRLLRRDNIADPGRRPEVAALKLGKPKLAPLDHVDQVADVSVNLGHDAPGLPGC